MELTNNINIEEVLTMSLKLEKIILISILLKVPFSFWSTINHRLWL